jgi:flagellar biogenesis protein FliO
MLMGIAAPGAEAEPAKEADVAAFPSPTVAPLTRIGLAVASVGAVGWMLALWARRRRGGSSDTAPGIRVLSKRSIGPRHHVALLEVGDHQLLVGLGGDSIRTLADLTPETIFAAELQKELSPQEHPGSENLLERIGSFPGLEA